MSKKQGILLLFSILLASCATKKEVHYFQDIKPTSIQKDFKFLSVQPGYALNIQTKSIKPESTLDFKPNFLNNQSQNSINIRLVDGYLVGE